MWSGGALRGGLFTLLPPPFGGLYVGLRRDRTRPTMFLPGFMLRSERVQEFVEDGRGGTKYTCWETFYGVLAQTTRAVVGKKVLRAIDRWTADLGERAGRVHSQVS